MFEKNAVLNIAGGESVIVPDDEGDYTVTTNDTSIQLVIAPKRTILYPDPDTETRQMELLLKNANVPGLEWKTDLKANGDLRIYLGVR